MEEHYHDYNRHDLQVQQPSQSIAVTQTVSSSEHSSIQSQLSITLSEDFSFFDA